MGRPESLPSQRYTDRPRPIPWVSQLSSREDEWHAHVMKVTKTRRYLAARELEPAG